MAVNPRRRRDRLLEAARGYLTLEMPRQALEELDRIDDPETCSLAVDQLRGEALRQADRYAEALQAYQRALAEDPDDVSVLLGMAWCYKRIGRLPKAIEMTERAHQASPQEPIILYNLACYFALAENKPQALSWLGRALRMEPSLRKLISEESDFDALREDSDFRFVVEAHPVSDVS